MTSDSNWAVKLCVAFPACRQGAVGPAKQAGGSLWPRAERCLRTVIVAPAVTACLAMQLACQQLRR